MNKARRHELKMLKFKKRLKQLNLVNKPGKFYAFRSHGAPCSCTTCSPGNHNLTGERKKEYQSIQFELKQSA